MLFFSSKEVEIQGPITDEDFNRGTCFISSSKPSTSAAVASPSKAQAAPKPSVPFRSPVTQAGAVP